jgi:hypothetical protein
VGFSEFFPLDFFFFFFTNFFLNFFFLFFFFFFFFFSFFLSSLSLEMPRPVLTAAGALALLCLAPHATQGFTETLECGDAMALASKGPFTPGEWLRYPSIGDATEMLSARSGGKAHPAEAHAAKLAGTKAALGATKAELLARESLRYDIIANSTEPGSRSRFQVVCYGKPEGSPVTFGDSVALRLLHRDEFLTDGHDGDLSDLYHSLSTNERDRNFATIARGVDVGHGHYAPPKQGAVFQFFDPASPSSRAQVSTNSTVVLRSSNLQTLTIEKPVLGLPFRRRAELRVLTADDLVLDKKGNKVNVTESAAGRVDWTSEEYSKAARTSYPGEATFLTRVLCATSGGKLCGGRGVCRRGRCDCLIEYDGMACELKRQFATCHLTGDPHVQTFDGRRFNVFSEGEYLAYYNPDAAAGVEEKSTESLTVTMRKAASGITSSVASAVVRSRGVAVAVAADGQVTVDCGSTIAKKVRRRGGHGLAIKGSDLRIRWQPKARRWRISSGASGLVVWVESFGWGVNVWARTFQVPRGVSTGLCGNYNGDVSVFYFILFIFLFLRG